LKTTIFAFQYFEEETVSGDTVSLSSSIQPIPD
jgi:hypothetical protein